MMTCKELVEVVTDYIEGTMQPDDLARFEEHLKLCPYCVDYVEQMRATMIAVGKVPDEPPEPETQQRLLEAFRNWKSR